MNLSFWLELVSLFLTLMVLLYLFVGDNALFRLVTYSFIGVAAGYVTVLVLFQVLLPRLSILILSGNLILLVVGLIEVLLGLLLFFKLSGRTSAIGTLPMAILVGIGAAVTIGGAVFGTLFGQIGATLALFPSIGSIFSELAAGRADRLTMLIEGGVTLVGVVCTLAYFQFSVRSKSSEPASELTARRMVFLEVMAKVGQVFIGITLGAMFAGVFTASISALIERIGFIINVVSKFF